MKKFVIELDISSDDTPPDIGFILNEIGEYLCQCSEFPETRRVIENDNADEIGFWCFD